MSPASRWSLELHGLSRENRGHVTEPITSHLMAARRAMIVYKTQRDQRGKKETRKQ